MFPKCGPVPTYAIFYTAGLIAHLLITLNGAPRMKVGRVVAWAIGVSYWAGMILGAKVLFDVLHHNFAWRQLVSIRHYMEGGMWGGPMAYLVLAVPLACVLTRRGPDRSAAIDLIALSLPLPLMLAKAGCLMNGCCEGAPSSWPWAIRFPPGGSAPSGVPLHPTQVYEFLVLAMTMIVLVHVNGPRWRGLLLAWFLTIYGLGRALTEIWRGDASSRTALGPVTASQAVLIAVALIAIACIAVRRRHGIQTPASGDPSIDARHVAGS